MWLSLFAAAALAADARPRIVSIRIGSDKTVVKGQADRDAKLRACGYDIVEVFGKDARTVKKELAAKAKPDDFSWLISHGNVLSDGEPLGPESDGSLSGGKIVLAEEKKLQSLPRKSRIGWTPKPSVPGKDGFHFIPGKSLPNIEAGEVLGAMKGNVFLQACYSGACPNFNGLGLAIACAPDSRCTLDDKTPELMIGLLCSAIGDCAEWYQADVDGDGLVYPRELNGYLARKIGHETFTGVTSIGYLEKVRGFCKSVKGDLTLERLTLARVKYQIEGQVSSATLSEFWGGVGLAGKDAPPAWESSDIADTSEPFHSPYPGSAAAAEGLFREMNLAWNGKKITAVTVETKTGYRYRCEAKENPFGQNSLGKEEAPLSRSLLLTSRKCRIPREQRSGSPHPLGDDAFAPWNQ